MSIKLLITGLVVVCSTLSLQASAKEKTDSIKVLGNCESCKSRIEKAAKTGGAIKADWKDESQVLTITYDDEKTTLLSIEKQIAAAGHDTRDVKSTDDAYTKLHSCCQYDRSGLTGAKTCDDEKKKD